MSPDGVAGADRQGMTEPFGPELTSIRSPKVKAARQLAKRSLRLRARSFLAEGPQAVGEALTRSGVVSQLFITAAARARHAELAEQAARQGAYVQAVSGEVMAGLAQNWCSSSRQAARSTVHGVRMWWT